MAQQGKPDRQRSQVVGPVVGGLDLPNDYVAHEEDKRKDQADEYSCRIVCDNEILWSPVFPDQDSTEQESGDDKRRKKAQL